VAAGGRDDFAPGARRLASGPQTDVARIAERRLGEYVRLVKLAPLLEKLGLGALALLEKPHGAGMNSRE
jgi:hypothetical protein